MKNLIYIIPILLAASCSQANDPISSAPDGPQRHTATMHMSAPKPQFEASSRAAADDGLWNTGDTITLSFTDTRAYGIAIYDAASKLWNVTYTGSLTPGEEAPVVVGYFCRQPLGDDFSQIISLAPLFDSYIDYEGTYRYNPDDGTISIIASLRPTTGRIRFRGEVGREVTLRGPSGITQLDALLPSFSTIEVPLTVAADGFTPYVYCTFPETENVLTVTDTDASYSVRLAENVLTPGRSGVITLPTPNASLGWDVTTDN